MGLGPRFSDALAYCAVLHADQQRKVSGAPYVSHLLSVAAIVLQYGGDEEEAIAALLHDSVEDQGGTALCAQLQQRFGRRVAEIVMACSDSTESPKPPWRQRKEAHVAHVGQADASVRLVVAADKLDNARWLLADYRRLGERLWDSFRGGREGTLWYYAAMIEALRLADAPRLNDLIDEVARCVAELERLLRSGT